MGPWLLPVTGDFEGGLLARRSYFPAKEGTGWAVEAGWEVLRAGGNAFDAAVTTALVQCVVDPVNTSLGGSGCAVFRDTASGQVVVVSFMSRAGARVTPDMWAVRGETVDLGYPSACVPGNVRGLSALSVDFGMTAMEAVTAPRLRWTNLSVGFEHSVHAYDPGFAYCHVLKDEGRGGSAQGGRGGLTGAGDPRAEGMALFL